MSTACAMVLLLADTDASINLECVLRRAIPLDWREQEAVLLAR